MDVDDWQANRIRNSRYTQDGNIKPWPSGIQLQILGAQGCGRRSLLERLCLGKHGENYNISMPPGGTKVSACMQTHIREQPCTIWIDAPTPLTASPSRGSKVYLPSEHQNHHQQEQQALFEYTARGIRDCDALILAYDVSSPRSFQILCEFCTRCELDGIAIAPGTSLPCVVVGLKDDLPTRIHPDDGWRLARRLGGRFISSSANMGRGFSDMLDEAIGPVVEARARLIHESEQTLGEAVRHLADMLSDHRPSLRKKLSMRRQRSRQKLEGPRPVVAAASASARPRCTGSPPKWTMRNLTTPPAWASSGTLLGSDDSDGTLVDPCPPQYQLPMDLIEPAGIDWGPTFEDITSRLRKRNRIR